jgi:predicted NBD/HSP70 family sugar kinase
MPIGRDKTRGAVFHAVRRLFSWKTTAFAAALGEQQFGSGMGMSSALYILISFGLGGGLLIDGHYLRGAAGRSGEIG